MMIRSFILVDYLQGIMKFTLENFTTHHFHLGNSLCSLEQLVYGFLGVCLPRPPTHTQILEECRASLIATVESPGKYIKPKNDDN